MSCLASLHGKTAANVARINGGKALERSGARLLCVQQRLSPPRTPCVVMEAAAASDQASRRYEGVAE